MSDSKRLKIAVQKKGRLSDDSIALLKAIGIKLQIRDRLLIAHSTNQPIDLLLVRDEYFYLLCFYKVQSNMILCKVNEDARLGQFRLMVLEENLK